MIKVANNIQRMLEKRAYGPEDITRAVPQQGPRLMYSPELGGFHAAGQYPQSMVPEAYQNIQARNYVNSGRFDEPESFDNVNDLAMALNTSGVVDSLPPGHDIHADIDRAYATPGTMQFGTEDPVAAIMRSRAMAGYAAQQARGDSPSFPPFMSTADLANIRRSNGNPYLKLHQQLLRERTKPQTSNPFFTARYDRSPDNPTGITAKNPDSDARVSSIASKLIEDTAKSQPRRLRYD